VESVPPQQPISVAPAIVLYAVQALLVAAAAQSLYGHWGFWSHMPIVPDNPVGVMPMLPFGAVALILGHMVALVLAYIAWGILHYACWQALPERYRATTPAQAVGFLFIPLFNFYWAFVSLPKLAEGFNALDFERPELHMKDARGLGVLKAISFVAYWTIAWLPGLAAAVCLADAIVFGLYYYRIGHNANLLIQLRRARIPGREAVA
jgi:hypothetical protein